MLSDYTSETHHDKKMLELVHFMFWETVSEMHPDVTAESIRIGFEFVSLFTSIII